MKATIITCAGRDRRIYRFLSSFQQNVKNAELMTISFKPHFPEARFNIDKSYPGHISKYFELERYVKNNKNWYIFTDMYDVLFMNDIVESEFEDGIILVSSEHHKWNENGYYKGILESKQFESLYDKTVYCSGTFAMQGYQFLELIEFYRRMKEQYKGGQLNQPLFNLFVQQYPHRDSRELFMTLHQGIDKGMIKKIDMNKFTWSDGVMPTMVHGNGSYFEKYMC